MANLAIKTYKTEIVHMGTDSNCDYCRLLDIETSSPIIIQQISICVIFGASRLLFRGQIEHTLHSGCLKFLL